MLRAFFVASQNTGKEQLNFVRIWAGLTANQPGRPGGQAIWFIDDHDSIVRQFRS